MSFWKTIYTFCAMGAIIYGLLYWNEVLPADNITLAFYCWGFGAMCFGEAIRRD